MRKLFSIVGAFVVFAASHPASAQQSEIQQFEPIQVLRGQPVPAVNIFHFPTPNDELLALMAGRDSSDPIIFSRLSGRTISDADPIFENSASLFYRTVIDRELIVSAEPEPDADIIIAMQEDILESDDLGAAFSVDSADIASKIKKDGGCSIYQSLNDGSISRTLALYDPDFSRMSNAGNYIKQAACEAKALLSHLGWRISDDPDRHWIAIGVFLESDIDEPLKTFTMKSAQLEAEALRATGWELDPRKAHLVLWSEIRPIFFPFYGADGKGNFGQIYSGQSRADVMELIEKGFEDNEYKVIQVDIESTWVDGAGEPFSGGYRF